MAAAAAPDRSVADVVRAFAASTVIGCEPVGCAFSPFATFGGHAAVTVARSAASSIGGQSSLPRCGSPRSQPCSRSPRRRHRPSGRDRPGALVDLRYSYRAGCPVGPPDLRTVRLSYWGFDGRAQGTLVVHRRVASDVVAVFRRLYEARFPIRRMQPISAYRGSDDASMAADNTSAFNCRRAVGSAKGRGRATPTGSRSTSTLWRTHVLGSRVLPPAGRRFTVTAFVPAWRRPEASS